MRAILLLLMTSFIFLACGFAKAELNFTELDKKAYNALLKLKLKEARGFIAQTQKSNPKNKMHVYLSNYDDFLTLMATEDYELFKKLSINEQSRLHALENEDPKSPYFLFIQAEIKLQWAVVRLKFDDKLTAVFGFKQAYHLLEENEMKFPDFLPNKKSIGILKTIFAAIPDKYKWASSVLGIDGNLTKGMDNLAEVAGSNDMYALEAQICQYLVETYILEQTDPQDIEILYAKNPDNLVIHFFRMLLLLHQHKNKEAYQAIMQAPINEHYTYLVYWNYAKAHACMMNANYPEAIEHYTMFLHNFKGKNLVKDSYFKLFLANWFLNKNTEASIFFNKIKIAGQTVADADKNAHIFAETKPLSDKLLMKAYILTEGGNYEWAKNFLDSCDVSSFETAKDKAEYCFRKARIFHELGDYAKAEEMYTKAIETGGQLPHYYAANACLQLGYIYQHEKKQKDKARNYFAKVLSYHDHEYKSTLDHKARAAIHDLDNKH